MNVEGPSVEAQTGEARDRAAGFVPPVRVKWDYSRAELIADGIVHALGLKLALIGVVLITLWAAERAGALEMTGLLVYCFGLVTVLTVSAIYNLYPASRTKWILRRFDHSAIYILIAGTYTAFLTQVDAAHAAPLLVILWGAAATGVTLKLVFPGRWDRGAILLYLAMGWSGVLGGEEIIAALTPTTLWLIVIGGAIYMAGIVFHLWETLRFHNAVWHAFVLVASACFYFAVLDAMVLAKS
ncbi:PAQR family membrane homeostasis protein TrhA [Salinarimonas ramus]|uniref:DNA-binding protein n=1 Tax=Salinarimonas ramus TaxID=690164 RepID=A0A917QGB6_9HYPH|nr:hemolysin III family protein [Salinarimonas ramus]GGK48492.1 DNA-binding protein [Salinarimonas ramus]